MAAFPWDEILIWVWSLSPFQKLKSRGHLFEWVTGRDTSKRGWDLDHDQSPFSAQSFVLFPAILLSFVCFASPSQKKINSSDPRHGKTWWGSHRYIYLSIYLWNILTLYLAWSGIIYGILSGIISGILSGILFGNPFGILFFFLAFIWHFSSHQSSHQFPCSSLFFPVSSRLSPLSFFLSPVSSLLRFPVSFSCPLCVLSPLPPSPLSSLRSPLSSLPLPSTYFFLLFPLSSLLSPLSCILFPVRVPTQNPCSPRGKETKWEPKHQRCLWGKTHLHANRTASKGAWAELESRVDPIVIMRSCRMSRPGAGIWSHAPTVRQFPHANLQRLESWVNPLY